MRLPRASGLLLHPTSLPSRFGIGDFGPAAETFVENLAQTGQRWWQMLPLGPTGYGNSPYQSHSSYAGNRLLISPERLVEAGWLSADDLRDYPDLPADRVDFDSVSAAKDALFRLAFANFHSARDAGSADFEDFLRESAHWLGDYALYMALKDAHDGRAWNDWEPDIAARQPEALESWRDRLDDHVQYHMFLQYIFFTQFRDLRRLCQERRIHLIGDLPIFVSLDSADVWARPDLFELDEQGRPTVVAGVPPDYFCEDGQLWGNPLYRWSAHKAENFSWWITRLKATIDRFDLVRLDHFRGFEAYWEVPADAPTAAAGRWALGPGAAFLSSIREGLAGLPLIAEDLGDITFEVHALRDRFELPGMRVLQFAFGDDPLADIYLPHRYIPHCFVYTGTHDNDTTVGWFTTTEIATTQSRDLVEAERAFVRRYVGTSGAEVHWDLIRLAFSSVADTAMVPLQDLLGLDSSARMNTPGTATGNWGWRYRSDQLDRPTLDRLSDLTAVYDRWNGTIPEQFRPPRRPKLDEPFLGR